MKIGLLTYHTACNFGANLQALSSFCYWKKQGHDPIFINWEPDEIRNQYKKATPAEQYEEHEKFREQYLKTTRRCVTDDEIAAVIKEEGIEAIVVGSDAVIQTHPFLSRVAFPCRRILMVSPRQINTSYPNPFWGSFCDKIDEKIPICCMSGSSQNSPYKKSLPKDRKLGAKLLSRFSYVSTRDDWTAKMVEYLSYGKIKPQVTPDPVFAFNSNVDFVPSEEDIRKRFGLEGPYSLFCFHNSKTVSQNWLLEMKEKMEAKGVKCVAFPFPQGIEFKHPFDKEIGLPLSPLDWYALIKYADSYIGDNMHPIVISLHNAVPCFSFDHYGIVKHRISVNEKSSKIYHILNTFGHLQNRVSIKGRYTEPSVDYVLDKIEHFDKALVKSKADEYLTAYNKMMNDISKAIGLK